LFKNPCIVLDYPEHNRFSLILCLHLHYTAPRGTYWTPSLPHTHRMSLPVFEIRRSFTQSSLWKSAGTRCSVWGLTAHKCTPR